MKIAHFADLHLRGTTRHAEYIRALELLFKQFKEQKVDAIVFAGDLWHTKTQNISPEAIEKLVWMFRELNDIAPTICILGNHDGNLANKLRQDTISPIIEALKPLNNIHLYKKSGVYQVKEVPSINWCVFSCFDKDGWNSVKPQPDGINIALYHGTVTGCVADNGMRLLECETEPKFFEKFDICMLGDMHSVQFMGQKPHSGPTRELKNWIGYPGSTIEQNFGESEEKGWLLWDIRDKHPRYKILDWDVDFVELPNMAPFITTPWKGNVEDTLNNIVEVRGPEKAFIEGSRFRIVTTQNLSSFEVKKLYHELKDKRGASEVVLKNDSKINLLNIKTGTVDIQKTSLRNNSEAILKLYDEFVDNHYNADQKVLPSQKEQAKEIIKEYIIKLNQQDTESTTRDVVWSIKNLEFDNLFRYSTGNKINFEKLNGIVGIFAANKAGKSSVVGSLMYCLYNTTDRGPIKSSQIINTSKKSCRAMALINVAGTDYVIVRSTTKTLLDEDKATTSLSFYRVDSTNGSMISLAEEQEEKRPDTDKLIRKLIGTPQDFLLTSFSSQGDVNRFIEEGPTQRKLILNRFLDLDIFEKLYEYVNEDCKTLNAKTGNYSTATWEATIFQTNKKLKLHNEQLSKVEEKINKYRASAEDIKLWIKQHEATSDMVVQATKLEKELDNLEHVQLPANIEARQAKQDQKDEQQK
jgi:DNA repair exonuclease SbcCD nuclease subunit